MLFPDRMAALHLRAAQAGNARLVPHPDGLPSNTVEWDVSGSCHTPVTRELISRKTEDFEGGLAHVLGLHVKRWSRLRLFTRCRNCVACARHRRGLWARRAEVEWRNHTLDGLRTWSGTLTIAPRWRTKFEYRAIARYDARGKAPHPNGRASLEWEALSTGERFKLIAAEISREITLWMKRVRKNSGAKLRYLLVTEAHKSGDPHFHICVYEDGTLRKAVMREQWTFGFTKWELVETLRGAVYLCKYLSKDMMARVRASVFFGEADRTASAVAALPRDESAPLNDQGPRGIFYGSKIAQHAALLHAVQTHRLETAHVDGTAHSLEEFQTGKLQTPAWLRADETSPFSSQAEPLAAAPAPPTGPPGAAGDEDADSEGFPDRSGFYRWLRSL